MSALRSTLARGGPVLLCIHALTAATALSAVGPLQDALARALALRGAGAQLSPADLSRVVELVARYALPTARASWPLLLVFALIAPALTVALAHALATGARLVPSLRAGASRSVAACAARAFAVLLFATGAVILTASFAFLLSHAPAALELPARLGYVALLGLHALGCATLHDLALARLALRRTRLSRALLAAMLRASPRVLTLRAAAACATFILTALADLCTRVEWPVPAMLAPALATALAQGLLFAALTCRALFLHRIVRPVPYDARSLFSLPPPPPRPAPLSPPPP